MHSYLFSKCMF